MRKENLINLKSLDVCICFTNINNNILIYFKKLTNAKKFRQFRREI